MYVSACVCVSVYVCGCVFACVRVMITCVWVCVRAHPHIRHRLFSCLEIYRQLRGKSDIEFEVKALIACIQK